mmetsp:Transcript_10037/g.23017  ORF Transcript_10037/g.23017 Transcript_10037/m.23017 type:complete len:94 (-) Transcript_10037:150-431(-)
MLSCSAMAPNPLLRRASRKETYLCSSSWLKSNIQAVQSMQRVQSVHHVLMIDLVAFVYFEAGCVEMVSPGAFGVVSAELMDAVSAVAAVEDGP